MLLAHDGRLQCHRGREARQASAGVMQIICAAAIPRPVRLLAVAIGASHSKLTAGRLRLSRASTLGAVLDERTSKRRSSNR